MTAAVLMAMAAGCMWANWPIAGAALATVSVVVFFVSAVVEVLHG